MPNRRRMREIGCGYVWSMSRPLLTSLRAWNIHDPARSHRENPHKCFRVNIWDLTSVGSAQTARLNRKRKEKKSWKNSSPSLAINHGVSHLFEFHIPSLVLLLKKLYEIDGKTCFIDVLRQKIELNDKSQVVFESYSFNYLIMTITRKEQFCLNI